MKRKQIEQIDNIGEQLSMFDNENTFSRQQTINILDGYLPQIRRAINNNYVIDAITMKFQTYPSGLHDIVAEIDIKNGDAYKRDILSLCLDTVTIAQTSLLKTLIKHIRMLTEYNYGERLSWTENLSDEDMLAWLTSRKQSYLRNNIVLLYNHSWLWGSGVVDQFTTDDLASDEDKVLLLFKGTFEISKTLIADWILYARDLYKKDLSRRAKGARKRRQYTWTSILRRKRDKIGIKVKNKVK